MNIITLFTCLLLYQAPVKPPAKADTIAIDTSRYSILSFNKSRDSFLFNERSEAATLSGKELIKVEKIIRVMVKEYNQKIKADKKRNKQKQPDAEVNNLAIKKPGNYYKQLIAITNHKGEKIVWVNCFCTPYEKRHWKKGVVLILDGGPCFFNLKINLSTNTVIDFKVNGVA
ncbi:hypothetical protein FFF34_000595 [Inquilinus sp. KBS0705]|nr:hypothetical protein FFF34_000595 [Inquilinus sp. KBS0705]